jgi:hypothetical protein
MLKTITTAVGMVLLMSSFALAGQARTAPSEHARVAQSQRSETNKRAHRAKRHHHKHHKQHHVGLSRR